MSQTRKDVLNGWKEIAAYLGRDPRTVERWEKQRSLPVRRLPGGGRATVYALTAELDDWLAGPAEKDLRLSPAPESTEAPADADPQPVQEPATTMPKGRPLSRPWLLWAAACALFCAVAGVSAVGWWHGRLDGTLDAPSVQPNLARLRHLPPSSTVPGVEDLYLRGSYQAERRTPEALQRARAAFTEAIGKDPHYAPAYAGLATTYLLLREYAMLPDKEAYEQATEAARTALTLDPEEPRAHAAMGFVDFFWRWDTAGADREFRQALYLDPNLPLAHHWYGSVLTHEGRFREGAAELGMAQRLDPGSEAILTTRALALGMSGQRAAAAEMLQEAISSGKARPGGDPATMHLVMGTLCLIPPRDVPRYLGEASLAAELRQDTTNATALQRAARVYDEQGERAMWRTLLTDETERHRSSGPTYLMARYKAALGVDDDALNDLSKLFARHDPALIGISVDPLFWGMSHQQRFQQLRTAMGLSPLAGVAQQTGALQLPMHVERAAADLKGSAW